MFLFPSSLALGLSLFSIASIASVCLFDSRIAAAPITIIAMTNSASAMASESQPEVPAATKSAIDSAITFNNRIFWLYVGILVIGAVVTVLLFFSGNKVQEAIKADADARLKLSEERIAVLTVEAEKAREGIAKGQADAAKAIERTGTLELETAKQRELAAKAERALLELKTRLAWRSLTREQEEKLIAGLAKFEAREVLVRSLEDAEALPLARQIASVFARAKWSVKTKNEGIIFPLPWGVICTHSRGDEAAEIFIQSVRSPHVIVYERDGSTFEILVGSKPPP